jgi:hypothetical protein
MKSFPTTLLVLFVLALLVPARPASADDAEVVLRPERVRAFAVEGPHSILVREGRETVRRVVLEGPCAGLSAAERVDFQIGAALLGSYEAGREVPVALKNAPPVVSSDTPHLHLVTAQGDERAACRVARIEAATAAEFDAAGGRSDVRDQRRDASGR